MWSLQHSAWEGRVGGVAYLSSAYEDPFVPQSEYKYQRTLFKAPGMRYCCFVFEFFIFKAKFFRRLIGCRIREGFLIKSIVVNSKKKLFYMYMYVIRESLSLSPPSLDSEIEILMDYQWQPNITIQYTLQTVRRYYLKLYIFLFFFLFFFVAVVPII